MSADLEGTGTNGTVPTFGFKGESLGATRTDVPLVMLSAYDYNKHKPQALPKLPSHRFRYSLWHDLKSTYATGDQLKAPRVRKAPDVKEKTFHSARDEEGQLIHHSLSGKGRDRHQHSTENWENTTVGNFPYQDLSQTYQRENFQRILRRLIRVKILNLAHNDLTSLSSHSFPCCEELNLNNNYISSFKDLPKLPHISYLTLCMNDIATFDGLERLAKSPLHTLNLYGNGITFTTGYRQRVFRVLPNLKVLDNVPKLDQDEEVFGEAERSCVIS